ncbi:hypothetical protein HKBW3S33_02162, partial [Candidatus Hakubella thermalkaliphila]
KERPTISPVSLKREARFGVNEEDQTHKSEDCRVIAYL